MGETLPLWSARVGWGQEGLQYRVIKEVRERSVANIMEETSNAQRLNDKPFTWGRYSVAR